jgi:hypothetical protein
MSRVVPFRETLPVGMTRVWSESLRRYVVTDWGTAIDIELYSAPFVGQVIPFPVRKS